MTGAVFRLLFRAGRRSAGSAPTVVGGAQGREDYVSSCKGKIPQDWYPLEQGGRVTKKRACGTAASQGGWSGRRRETKL